MPPQPQEQQQGDGADEQPLGPPPSVGRQVAQLIVIPALIVIICVGLSVMFGLIAGADADIDAYLARLRQSGGSGRMAMNLQDPRYKDRSLAAYNIATLIPKIDDPAERKRISNELTDILENHIGSEEELINVYLLLAIGQLGQDGGLDVLIDHMDDKSPKARQGAVGGVMNWPDRTAARQAMPGLIRALQDPDPLVATQSAAALGAIAPRGDEQTIAALQEALQRVGSDMREAKWNAAVALARHGDPRGSRIVAAILLDRDELAKLSAGTSGVDAQRNLDRGMQDRIILSTLSAAGEMTAPEIWSKIKSLAEQDPNSRVRSKASQLLLER